MLRFKGSQNFRQRLLFATLSGRPLRIDEIRADDSNPGLRDFEASFLRLLEKLTNGCVVEINETGERRLGTMHGLAWGVDGVACLVGSNPACCVADHGTVPA